MEPRPTQTHKKGYKFYNQEAGRIMVTLSVTFDEIVFFCQKTTRGEFDHIQQEVSQDNVIIPYSPILEINIPIKNPPLLTSPSETPEQEEPPIENVVHDENPPSFDDDNTNKEDQNTASENVLQNPTESSIWTDPIALHKGKRECTKKLYPICKYVSMHNLSPSYRSFLVEIDEYKVPQTVNEDP